MLLRDDARKKIAIIIASGKGADKMVQKDEMTDNKLALLSAGEEVLNAIKSDDKEMLVESMCALIDMHLDYREDMKEDEEKSDY